MNIIFDIYLNLSIRFRIALLCICYSFCIVASGLVAHFASHVITIVAMSIFIVLGLIFGYINMRTITTSIDRTISYLKAMAGGDLSQEIVIRRNNEISATLRAIKELQESMNRIISGIKGTSRQMADESGNLFDLSAGIADHTVEAASQSTSVSVAIDQLASTSVEISDSCNSMSSMANKTTGLAQNGEKVVGGMARTMEQIESMMVDATGAVRNLGTNSEHIDEILSTISDIADQTNLLALNAAIEAARAGEQGRGFAVVADEVRSLAERTSKATQEIQKIISALQKDVHQVINVMERSGETVRNGGKEVQNSCDAIAGIRREIELLHDHVSHVATAATEQSATTSDLTRNMHLISGVLREAASGAEQTKESAKGFAQSSDSLQQMVNQFTIK